MRFIFIEKVKENGEKELDNEKKDIRHPGGVGISYRAGDIHLSQTIGSVEPILPKQGDQQLRRGNCPIRGYRSGSTLAGSKRI